MLHNPYKVMVNEISIFVKHGAWLFADMGNVLLGRQPWSMKRFVRHRKVLLEVFAFPITESVSVYSTAVYLPSLTNKFIFG